MSTPTKSASPTPFADRLFARFGAIYGVQKVGAMFSDASAKPEERDRRIAQVRVLWEAQLSRFDERVRGEIIGKALQALVDRGDEWPPTLPQFIAICKDFRRPGQPSADEQKALLAPGQGHTDAASAVIQLARIKALMATAVKPMAHKAD